jgi:hypothetical protein
LIKTLIDNTKRKIKMTLRNLFWYMFMLLTLITVTACGDYSIEQTKVGREYHTTGLLIGWSGQTGFVGPVKQSGTYFAGPYTDIRKVNCAESTDKETLKSLTKDNIQFSVDVYVRQSANCNDDAAVIYLLNKLKPESQSKDQQGNEIENAIADGKTITNTQVYDTYIRAALGEAVRKAVSPYNANDVLANRDKIYSEATRLFNTSINSLKPKVVNIYDLKFSNFDPPDALEGANVDLAKQAILTQKATAEALTVKEQEKTALAKKDLAKAEAKIETARIEELSSAIRANPEYFRYLQLMQAPAIYEKAGAQGNLVLLPSPNATVMVNAPSTKEVKK